jgi:hypothetical protein
MVSDIAGKTFPDLIKPSIKRVESGMKAFVVKVKYIAAHDHPEKPVMTLQVSKDLLGRMTDEGGEAQQEIHLRLPMRAMLETLLMSVSVSERG